MTSKTPP
jgi:hypothetical protein